MINLTKMEKIIKDLEHTIKYFEDAQNDFQRGRAFQAKKTLEALRIHDVVGRSEQLVCEYCNEDSKPTCCDNCLEGMVNAVQKAN